MSEPASKTAEKAVEIAEEAAAKAKLIAGALEDGAHNALESIERGVAKTMTRANATLAAPDGADLGPLLAATDLPELDREGPLGSLGVRLDREADLYRNVALRELSRVAWMDRVTLISVLVAFVGEVGVATCAALSALIGALDGRGGLFSLAAVIFAVAPAVVAVVVNGARRVHRDLATESLARSRVIEERLFQLGIVLEWRGTEPTLFQDALARLEGRAKPEHHD